MSFLIRMYRRQAAKLMYRRGITYEHQQSYWQAIEAFSSALKLGYSRPAEALVQIGVARIGLQDREGAIASFKAAICSERSDPHSLATAQAYFHLGSVRQQMGDEAAALNSWAAAIACCPTYAYPYYHRALIAIAKGDYSSARSDLDAAVEAHPTFAAAYYQRGLLCHQSGDRIGAVSDLQCAVFNDSALKAARQTLAQWQQDAYNAQLSQVLAAPLAEKALSVKVYHRGSYLDIRVQRAVGVGVSYYTLPEIIRQHVAPLLLDGVSRFQLTGQVGDVTRPEWNQSYSLYKDRPCPHSHWPAAILTLLMFPPLAVPALIQAAWVKRAYKQGKYVEALSASKVVKGLSIASSLPFAFFMLLSVSYSSYDVDRHTPTDRSAEQIEVAERQRRNTR